MDSEIRGRQDGERIAVLEDRYEHVIDRINHLDYCVDDVKKQAAENAELVRRNAQVWDDRWSFGKGVFWTVSALLTILSGVGLVLLTAILERLKLTR